MSDDPRRFLPEAIFAEMNDAGVRYLVIGGIAAVLHGSPLRTGDADICPARDPENLESLATALERLDASIRAGDEAVPLPKDAALIGAADIWDLTTRAGDLDIAFVPSGTDGYDDLIVSAVHYELDGGVIVAVASLEDVIRSKRAADRQKDRDALPTLEALREESP